MKKMILAACAFVLAGSCLAQNSDVVKLVLSNVATGTTASTATSGVVREGFIKRIVLDVGAVGSDATYTIQAYNSAMGTYETLFTAVNVTTNVDIHPVFQANTIHGGTATNFFISPPLFREAIVFSGHTSTATGKNASAYIIWNSQP